MHRLTTLLLGVMILFAFSGIGSGSANEIFVEPGDSIQTAVSGASPGDVIIVKPGTYIENIRITTTPDLVIRSETGKPEDTIITAKSSSTNVFYTEVNNTTISGFKITGVDSTSAAGVYLVRCSNCIITNNDLSDNYVGVYLRYSDYNRLLNNTVFGKNRGFYLQDSNYNTLSGNRANSSDKYGIHLLRSQRNTLSNNTANLNNYGIVLESLSSYNNLTGNTVNSNSAYGIYLTNSDNCLLTGNTATNDSRGIYLITSHKNTISDNTVSENNNYGILISLSNYNIISGNTANKTFRGIHLDSSDGNTVSGNTVASNNVSGLFMCAGSDSNRVFNNYLNNTYNADIYNKKNTWNTTKTTGTNIVRGIYIGGNFWANPAGTGFSQTAQDANGGGISDTEYAGTNFTDYLPLLPKSTPQQSILPVANFNSNVTSGNAPLTVQFTDTSQYATGWNWDFESDGKIDSSIQNPVSVYTAPGTYTVGLTAINPNGTNSKSATITVYAPYQPIPPVSDFSANITSGYAPLSVQFTDFSQNADSWSWDFDNDGTPDSGLQNPVHVYEVPNSYTVNMSVSNENGTNSKTATIVVREAESVNKRLPVVDFSANVTSGYAPLSVLFTDLSQNATGIGWDFDNDGLADVSSGTVIYVYTSPGIYTVTLTAANENGTTSKTAIINVEKKSSGGSSSGSSSGGGGGSPEPAKNVEVKELSQVFITNGKAVKFDFVKNATCVVYVDFDAKKTVGKTTTIVEELKNKSSLVSELPSGEVYKSFNIWVGNGVYATEKNIENPALCFKVEKAWIQDKKIDQASITLDRYSSKTWEQLPVSLVSEDEKYLYFTADLPGFSSFAITGEVDALPEEGITEIAEQETGSIEDEGMESTGFKVGEGTEQEEKVRAPGFEMIYGVFCLLAIFLYQETRK
ncbi:MAG: NosD domain-containing protein [Methanosarcina sp.]|uniref:NosD domain-containing protein n=1 Tax=Methanosarcina sp. TaxID=2213 RepID=UPI00263A277F|nr:NosD domain-containing protein [Methanosarcina sp.]MDD3247319.1 NosD domain-containing protein [Methanosarcina sp.]MDD4247977.1 NosD domain-containing protein [Methanosarcina sp.]